MIEIRRAVLPDDLAGMAGVDTGFETDRILTTRPREMGFDLVVRREPAAKRFPLDDLEAEDRPWDTAWVAVTEGRIGAFAAVGWQAWNRRLALWHLYVDRPLRRTGVGRALVAEAIAHGRSLGAAHLWLETTNLNAPGVAAYQAMGFAVTGLDLTLYEGSAARGEFAIFMSLPLEARGA